MIRAWMMNRSLSEMDVVYPVKSGNVNHELRLSMRSLVNFPHRKVWITGYKPAWLADCGYIESNDGASKEARLYNSVLAAASHPELSDPFVLFNDDFFITAPVTKLPPSYLKPLRDHAEEPIVARQGSGWSKSLVYTLELLESLGVKNPLSYELHLPMMFDKKILVELMTPYVSDHPPQLRSLYGNLAKIGGTRRLDVKAVGRAKKKARPIVTPFLSTNPDNFDEFAARLRAMFPQPSPYEAAGSRQVIGAFIEKRRLRLERAKAIAAARGSASVTEPPD